MMHQNNLLFQKRIAVSVASVYFNEILFLSIGLVFSYIALLLHVASLHRTLLKYEFHLCSKYQMK